jgi:hypothetical protein
MMGINLDSKTVPDHKVPALARVPNCTAVPDHKVPRYTREFRRTAIAACAENTTGSHATMQPMGDQTSEQEDGGDSHGHHGHGHPRHPATIAAANLGEDLLCAGKSARRRRPAASVRACSLALSSSSSASLLPLCALPLGCRSQVVSLAGQLLLPDGSGLAGGCSR